MRLHFQAGVGRRLCQKDPWRQRCRGTAAKGQGMPPSPSAVPGASGTPAVQRRLDIAINPVLAEGGFQHGVHRVGDFRAKTSFQAKAVLKAILKAFGYPK